MDISRIFTRLRIALPLFIAILAVAFLYSSSISMLWKKWILWDQDLAHALPTLALMFVLLAQRHFTATKLPAKTPWYWLQLLALCGCSLLWYLFESLSISLPAYLLIIVILCLFISTSLSTKTMAMTLPYIGLIVFTIPIWSELTNALVSASSTMVGYAVKLSNLTALLDGNSILLPYGTIHIADGCSGLRYFTIALLMGYTLVLINQYSPLRALATIAIAIMLGLVANWLRIYLLVLIGYYTEMQSSLMEDHESFGWIIFACILIPSIYFSPVSKQQAPCIEIPQRPSLLPVLPLLLGPLLLYFSSVSMGTQQPLQLSHLDNDKSLNQNPIGARLLVDIPNRESRLIAINQQQLQVDLFTQIPKEKKEEIVPYIGRIIDSSIWSMEKRQRLSIATGDNFDLEIYKQIGGQARILIAKQYIVGSYHTDKYINAKLLQLLAKATGDSYFGLLIIQTNCATDCANEITTLAPALEKISTLKK